MALFCKQSRKLHVYQKNEHINKRNAISTTKTADTLNITETQTDEHDDTQTQTQCQNILRTLELCF